MRKRSWTRRGFVGSMAVAGVGAMVVPRCAVAGSRQISPNEKLNIASIGVGGMGRGDVNSMRGENIIALCDVDQRRSGDTFESLPNARPFRDFRKMFDALENKIDAVTVSTPDHTHAVAAMAAITRGKHVYCQKPLAHSVYEVRTLMKAAEKYDVVTQLGNQGHSFDSIRTFCEWIWDGAIGDVHTIHLGCAAVNSKINQLANLKDTHPIPAELDWDQWLGPAADRPYHPAYLPGSWRGWTPFGNGTVGDWTCHVVDPVYWALDLGSPTSIQAEVKDYDPKTQGDAFPTGEIITYEFAAKGDRPAVTMHWYSGTEKIPRPAALEEGRKSVETGAVVLGDKGTITYGSHGAGGVRIIPEVEMQKYEQPEKMLPRGLEHHRDWLDSIRAGVKSGSDFATYGGPLTELAMLGVIAIKLPGVKLEWDTAAMRFTNSDEANLLVKPPYRDGWTL